MQAKGAKMLATVFMASLVALGACMPADIRYDTFYPFDDPTTSSAGIQAEFSVSSEKFYDGALLYYDEARDMSLLYLPPPAASQNASQANAADSSKQSPVNIKLYTLTRGDLEDLYQDNENFSSGCIYGEYIYYLVKNYSRKETQLFCFYDKTNTKNYIATSGINDSIPYYVSTTGEFVYARKTDDGQWKFYLSSGDGKVATQLSALDASMYDVRSIAYAAQEKALIVLANVGQGESQISRIYQIKVDEKTQPFEFNTNISGFVMVEKASRVYFTKTNFFGKDVLYSYDIKTGIAYHILEDNIENFWVSPSGKSILYLTRAGEARSQMLILTSTSGEYQQTVDTRFLPKGDVFWSGDEAVLYTVFETSGTTTSYHIQKLSFNTEYTTEGE